MPVPQPHHRRADLAVQRPSVRTDRPTGTAQARRCRERRCRLMLVFALRLGTRPVGDRLGHDSGVGKVGVVTHLVGIVSVRVVVVVIVVSLSLSLSLSLCVYDWEMSGKMTSLIGRSMDGSEP